MDISQYNNQHQGTESRGKTAVLLDFVQFTPPAPLPQFGQLFFWRQNSRFDGDNDADGDDDDDGGGWSLIELSSQGVPRLASLLSDKPE